MSDRPVRFIQYVHFCRRHPNNRRPNRRSKTQGPIEMQLRELARGPCFSLTLPFRLPDNSCRHQLVDCHGNDAPVDCHESDVLVDCHGNDVIANAAGQYQIQFISIRTNLAAKRAHEARMVLELVSSCSIDAEYRRRGAERTVSVVGGSSMNHARGPCDAIISGVLNSKS